jgi:Fic family protein
VVRLLTYAMLIKYGFQVSASGRLLNPAAVFCADRDRYYAMLALADGGQPAALEEWCIYVLGGIRDELQKVSRLADHAHLQAAVLLPALAHARKRQLITAQEEAVLQVSVRAGVVKAADMESAMPGLNANQRTYQIRKLVDAGLLQAVRLGARQYCVGFTHNLLLRGVIQAMTEQGFVSDALAAPRP